MNYEVYYINLDIRPDRNEEIKNELEKIFDKEKIKRFSGILHKNGAIGCGMRHIEILKKCRESDKEHFFIFEDDAQFEFDNKKIKEVIFNFLETKEEYDIILLSYNMSWANIKIINNKENIGIIKNGQTTAGYLINKRFIDKLIINWETSVNLMLNKKKTKGLSIDQSWKTLQNEKNKFYCFIPRLAKQRDNNYSDIEKINIEYGGTCIMAILTCKKYLETRVKNQDLKNSCFFYKYFVGDKELKNTKEENNIVYLPCGDNYEDLSEKVYEMIKYIIKNYPYVNYIFKTNDDIKFNFNNLISLYKNICYEKENYYGNVIKINEKIYSTKHKNKCDDKNIEQEKIELENCEYCNGDGYFISKNAIKIILESEKKYNNIYEDYSIGLTLNKNNIYPKNIDMSWIKK